MAVLSHEGMLSCEKILTSSYRVFGVTRIPGIPEDRIIIPPFPNPNKHVSVIIRDQIFTLNTRDDKGNLKPKDAIEAALWMMVYDVTHPQAAQDPAVGVLTGSDRDSWAEVRPIQPLYGRISG